MEKELRNVKVLFRYYSDLLEEEIVETMWAKEIDEAKGVYQLDSIPFYGPDIAPDDIFHAVYDESEQMLTFREVLEFSGNSVVQVILLNEPYEIAPLQRQFEEFGCIIESLKNHYFSMQIPSAADYRPIKEVLELYKQSGRIDYAEPVLSNQHQH